jgi:hypothetical protein
MRRLPTETHRSSYSLATMLLATAVVSIALAAGRNAALLGRENLLKSEQFMFYGIGGAAVGILVGIGIGATRPKPVLGVLLGIFGGIAMGGSFGALFSLPNNFPVAAIGAGILLLFGIVVRAFSRRSD